MALRGGRYETLRVIASGGMATVYLGRALGAGGFERLVAIKVMHPHIAAEPEFVAMFLDEARLAARIRHPNVVSTMDVQQDEEGLFLVMDYVEGPSLHHLIRALAKKSRRIPLGVSLRIFLDALAGLHAAHDLCDGSGEPLHLVHRDVSPQNVLIGVDGIAKITDFGVARAESRLSNTSAGVVKGKVAYMAPEQIRSQELDRRTDIYAAGLVLWEMCVSKRLIRGDNDAAMMDKILRGDHPSPRDFNAEVPEAIASICLKALSRLPEDRFATAAEFAETLEDAAIAGGIAIATPRVVAQLIKELDVHKKPTDLPSPPSSSGVLDSQRSMPMSVKSSVREGSVSGATPVSAPGTGAPQTHADAVISTPLPAPAPRKSRAMLLGVGAVLCVVVGGFLALKVGRVDEASPSAGGTPEQAIATATAAAAAPAPEAAPATATATATATASAAATEAASAAASAIEAASAPAPVVRPKVYSTGRPKPRPAPTSTTFRPREL